jgi:outer membrane protein
MKTLLLLAALTAGYFSHAQNQAAATQGKVGYANMEYIISQMPDIKQIETELKSTQTQLRNQIQAKSQQVQKQYTDFNTNMKTMQDTVRVNRQRDLEVAMAELEKMQQDAQVTLQNKQKLFMAPVILKVNKAIQEVATENGYDIILTDRVSQYDFLLYQTTQLDISNLVLQKFGVTPAK